MAGRGMTIPVPAGVRNVESTYRALRDQLAGGRATTAELVDAVDYWIARLKEDRAYIVLGKRPIPDPDPD